MQRDSVEDVDVGWLLNVPATCECISGTDRLVGVVVRRPPRERKIPGSNPAYDGIFSGSSHTSDFKTGTPVGYPARRLVLQGQHWDWSAGVSIL